MNESTRMNELKAQLETELASWQTKIGEARVQLDLGSKEAKDKLQPYIKQLESEMDQAKEKLAQLDDAAEHSWADIKSGLGLSIETMKEAFSSAQKHFSSDKTS